MIAEEDVRKAVEAAVLVINDVYGCCGCTIYGAESSVHKFADSLAPLGLSFNTDTYVLTKIPVA